MRVLLVGGGGREHALAWALSRSPRVEALFAVPGNPGIAELAQLLPGPPEPAALVTAAHREGVELALIGPEAPLAAGAADALRDAGVAVLGPGRDGARLEANKRFAKDFMRRHRVPTADYRAFRDPRAAREHLRRVGAPVVVKDAHLAAGKGVTVATDLAQAEAAVEALFARAAAHPPPEVVIEAFLEGQEVSLLLFCDGRSYRTLPLAQDYKQAFDGDRGPMTGGMGAVAPVALLDEAGRAELERAVVAPTVAGLQADGIDFRGVLFIGLMLTADGPRVLEYNVRFGDPEIQALLPLLATDLAAVALATAEGRLREVTLRWHPGAACCVVMAAPGYPGPYRRDIPIALPDSWEAGVWVFHAGTAPAPAADAAAAGGGPAGRRFRSAGGRVLDVVARGEDVAAAVAGAYRALARVDFPGAHYRRDIGGRLPGVGAGGSGPPADRGAAGDPA